MFGSFFQTRCTSCTNTTADWTNEVRTGGLHQGYAWWVFSCQALLSACAWANSATAMREHWWWSQYR